VVATLGTATTQQHVEQLFRLAPNLVFCFDGDRAGQDAAWRAIEQLLPSFRDGLDAKFLFLPHGEDPDSLIQQQGSESFLNRIKQAIPLSDALFNRLEHMVDLSTPSGRAKLVKLAKPLLNSLPEGVFRQLMLNRLSERVGVRLERLIPDQVQQPKQTVRNASLPSVHSPIRKGIALVLNDPGLAQRVSSVETLSTLDLPGINLLVKIIENCQADPKLSAGAVIERYRGSEHHKHLLQLMKWAPPAETEYDNLQEFDDVINTLRAKLNEQRTSQLIYKERNQGLNPEEKVELRDLLHSH
jgi:DNA primase